MIKGNFKKGDLVAYSGYLGKLYPGVFVGSAHTYHFWPLTQRTLDRLAEHKKPYVDYITGPHCESRIVKITTDVLEPDELVIYQKLNIPK